MKIAIAAQPETVARWEHAGHRYEEPVIAWIIETEGVNPRPHPIGVKGWCDDNAEIFIKGKAVPK